MAELKSSEGSGCLRDAPGHSVLGLALPVGGSRALTTMGLWLCSCGCVVGEF